MFLRILKAGLGPDAVASVQDDKLRWQSLGKASLHSNFMGSSLLGSLPQGLSVDERTKILQSTPLSPTLNLLSSMPSVSNAGGGGCCCAQESLAQ